MPLNSRKKPTVPFSDEFGEYLRDLRLGADLSQGRLGELVGVGSQMVSNWERGLCGPSFETLVKLTELFKLEERVMLKKLMDEQEKIFRQYLMPKKRKAR